MKQLTMGKQQTFINILYSIIVYQNKINFILVLELLEISVYN